MKKQLLLKIMSIAALVGASSPASAQYSFLNVADTATAAPDGTLFLGFGPPAINGDTVAFVATYDGPFSIVTHHEGVFFGRGVVGEPLITIAKSSDDALVVPAAPFPQFYDFGAPAISGGTVAFDSSYTGGGSGIFTGSGGLLTTVAKPGDPTPFGSPFAFFVSAAPGISSDGTVAFVGFYGAGGAGVFTKSGGTLTPIARIGGLEPTLGTAFVGFNSPPAISGGRIAFTGSYSGGQGVFSRIGGDLALTTIAKRGDPAPVVPTAPFPTFTGFSPPSISGVRVAFVGLYGFVGIPPQGGVFAGSDGGLTTLAKTGDAVPGVPGGTFNTFIFASISFDTVAFAANYSSSTRRGIFSSRGGILSPVIKSGDPLFGSSVTSLSLSSFGLDADGSGSIAFGYSLADGRSGVAIASPAAPNRPPVAVATISPDIDLDDGDPTFLVMSLNPVDAEVTLDGTGSTDPDGDYPLTYEWLEKLSDGSFIPIWSGDGDDGATHMVLHLAVGSHTIVLRVTDYLGLPGLDKTVTVKVITRLDAIDLLAARVDAMISENHVKYQLIYTLGAIRALRALGSLGFSPLRPYCNTLGAFQNQLDADVLGGRISSAVRDELSVLADLVLGNVDCP